MPAASAPAALLRHRRAGRNHPPRPHRRPDGESIFRAPPGTPGSHLRPPVARANPQTHVRSHTLPGTIAAHRHDRRQFHRRRSRRPAPRHGIQTLPSPHARNRSQTPRRHDCERNLSQGARGNHPLDHVIRALRIPRIPRRQLRPHRLCQRLPEMPLPRRLHRRLTQQSANGLLFSRNYRERRPAPRPETPASGCDVLRMELQFGKSHQQNKPKRVGSRLCGAGTLAREVWA